MAIVISGVNNNDKITAADGTIDLLSGVSYESTITAPDFTASNNITAASINVGSNIQLGNAGIATATTFNGNLFGNVNNMSNLLLQIGGSEKFRISSQGQLGIGGANYGTAGQVLTSGGSGSAATWSTIPTPDADKITEGNTKAEVIDAGSEGYFIVETEGVERIRIKHNGNMGVNTNNPQELLHVNGTTQSTDYKYTSHPGHAVFTGDNSTTSFTIQSGHSVNSILVVYNGAVLTPTTDYTVSGTTLTMNGFTPPNNAHICVRYLVK